MVRNIRDESVISSNEDLTILIRVWCTSQQQTSCEDVENMARLGNTEGINR
jgi:hypothetical protein